MQCRIPRMQTMISTVDVALSGTFDSSYGYVTIDGTKYTSAQTLKVAKGTSVTVRCSSNMASDRWNAKITLNGTTVAQGASTEAAEYTFAATDNCTITVTKAGTSQSRYYTAAITMPA